MAPGLIAILAVVVPLFGFVLSFFYKNKKVLLIILLISALLLILLVREIQKKREMELLKINQIELINWNKKL